MIAIKAFKRRKQLGDWRAAMVASVIANVNRPKGRRAYKVSDFMPREKRRQSWQDQLKQVELLNAMLGGKDLRGQRNDATV